MLLMTEDSRTPQEPVAMEVENKLSHFKQL